MSSIEQTVDSGDMIGGSTTFLYVAPGVYDSSYVPSPDNLIGLAQGFSLESSKNIKTLSQLGKKERLNVCSRGQKGITIPIIVTRAHNAIGAFYPNTAYHIVDVNDDVLKNSFGLVLVIKSVAEDILAQVYFEGASIVSFGSQYTANDKGVAEQVAISWTNTYYITTHTVSSSTYAPPVVTGGESLVSMDNVTLSILGGASEDYIGMIQQIQLQSARQITTHGEIGSDYIYQIIHDDGQGGITFVRRVLLSKDYENFISRLFARLTPLEVDLDQSYSHAEKDLCLTIPGTTEETKTRIKMSGCVINRYSLSINSGRNEIIEQVSVTWTKAEKI